TARLLADRIRARMNSVNGVESAAMASSFPFNPVGLVSGPSSFQYEIQGRPVVRGEVKPMVDIRAVSPNYFETIRQPLVKGRSFTEHDNDKAPAVAIINQTMARHQFPDRDPIGQRITFDSGQTWTEIVGIAGDVKEFGLDRPVSDEIYLSFRN